MILVTVQFYHINAFFVRAPADVSEIAVGRVTGFQVNSFFGCRIVNSHGNFMAGHSCHRILVRFEGGDTGSGIHLRVIRYHCFIHAVKSEQVSFRTPECTFINTEFLTVYTLTAYDAFGFIGYLVGFTVCCGYKQIIGNGISQRTAVFVPVLVGCFGSDGLAPYYFFFVTVNQHFVGRCVYQHPLFGIWKRYIV